MSIFKVPANALCLKYPHGKFEFKSTKELEGLKQPIGQDRAVEALRFGTNIEYSGYNIYALGPSGIGKHQIVEQFLQQKASKKETPSDWVYVNNFLNQGNPIAIKFPSGEAKAFQTLIQQFIEDLSTSIPSIYDSERYRSRRDSVIKEFKDQQDALIENLQERAKKEKIYLLTIRGGLLFAYGDDEGKILDDEAIVKLAKEKQQKISEKVNQFNDELANIVNQFPILERQMRLRIKNLNREMVSATVETLAKDIKQKYSDNKKVSQYFKAMVQDIIDNAKDFRHQSEEQKELREMQSFIKRYEVNVIIDHVKNSQAPVIYEDNPTFMNLVGQIEHISQLGALITDFTLIKPGALHRSNGGYLILDAAKLLTSPYAWEGLKRTLKAEQIKIESLGQVYSLISTVTLKPEPIPLNCKVIIIGERELYHLLVQYDPEFSDLFKVSADFENDMIRNPEHEDQFIRLLRSLVKKYKLNHLDASAIARVLEHSTRLSSDNERLSINLRPITNLLKEADYFAKQLGQQLVTANEVQKAIDAQIYRASRIYERIIEETQRETLLIDVTGKKVGQVNGLSVFEFGHHLFGHPTRITAVVHMGDGQVVDIEREVKMGGPIHSKGVFILSGFLKSRFAVDVPLSISASLVFEQSYGTIEGDSASLAELSVLLSALSMFAIKQSIAITGSVNQHGVAQPVGGINQKIEGFF